MAKQSQSGVSEVKLAEAPASVVEPSIRVVGEKNKHPMQDLVEGKNCPVIVSVGILRVPETNTYMSYAIHTQGLKVIKVEVEEPNVKGIAVESCKCEFVSRFIDTEDF